MRGLCCLINPQVVDAGDSTFALCWDCAKELVAWRVRRSGACEDHMKWWNDISNRERHEMYPMFLLKNTWILMTNHH